MNIKETTENKQIKEWRLGNNSIEITKKSGKFNSGIINRKVVGVSWLILKEKEDINQLIELLNKAKEYINE